MSILRCFSALIGYPHHFANDDFSPGAARLWCAYGVNHSSSASRYPAGPVANLTIVITGVCCRVIERIENLPPCEDEIACRSWFRAAWARPSSYCWRPWCSWWLPNCSTALRWQNERPSENKISILHEVVAIFCATAARKSAACPLSDR